MCCGQLERQAQQDYISGKRYEAQKNINKFKGNQYTKEGGCIENIGNQYTGRNATANKQAISEGVGINRIKDNAAFARGVDTVREVSPTLAEKILKPIHRTAKFGIGGNLRSLYIE